MSVSDTYLRSSPQLSAELWLQIFRNLERNELDNCARVCNVWRHMIKKHNKYLRAREIEYVILSSKRIFSMILSSGRIIKVYRCQKYYNHNQMSESINSGCFMSVQTLYRKNPLQPGKIHSTEYLFNELRVLLSNDDAKQIGYWDGGEHNKFKPLDAIGLNCPPIAIKTHYKLATPPHIFFTKLNQLLRNLGKSFTMTNTFIEKFMQQIEPSIRTEEVKQLRVKNKKVNARAIQFFISTILGAKTH